MNSADSSPQPSNPPEKSLLIVLSGPSGVGKDTVLTRLKERDYPLAFITTTTTRPRRPDERDGVDYRFVSKEKFQQMIKDDELLEWAEVYGNWYGVPKGAVKSALDKGQDVMVKVDVQGAITIKKIVPQAVFIFLMPPSTEELTKRLERRHTESLDALDLRLKTAKDEMKQLPMFDYVVLNKWDEVDLATADIKAIIAAEKCRVIAREIRL
jgi:guanylate kinase